MHRESQLSAGILYCLYTITDIYSRYTAGWMIATAENKALTEQFLSATITKYEGRVAGGIRTLRLPQIRT